MMLVIPSGRYHAFRLPYCPLLLVLMAPALQLIFTPQASVLILLRNLLFLNAVTVEHPSKYTLLLGSSPPCANVTLINCCASSAGSCADSSCASRYMKLRLLFPGELRALVCPVTWGPAIEAV
jgi:hypothetical protein